MNIKFRMPRFGNKLKGQSMLKEMAMTIIATTISIVLTFGSASVVEKRQKEKNRRQTVMMVIHDIENNIEQVKGQKNSEEYQITLTHYVQNHLDEIELLSLDTLKDVYDYLLQDESGEDYKMDNSIESSFRENLSLWSSLDDNMKIIDLVQEYFNDRHSQLVYWNNSSFFKYPISKQEQLAMLCEGSKDGYPIRIKQILKEQLCNPRVQFFLQYSPYRQDSYDKVVDHWQKMADRLKFMIGVTDEELKSFVEAHEQLGRIVTKKDILGEWVKVDSMYGYANYLFDADKSYNIRVRNKYKNAIYSGMIVTNHSFVGTWDFKGDTLVMRDNPNSFGYCIDVSRIQYSEGKHNPENLSGNYIQPSGIIRDSVNLYVMHIKGMYDNLRKWHKQGHVYKCMMRIDESGNEMEVTCFEDDNTEPSVFYLKKKNKNK